MATEQRPLFDFMVVRTPQEISARRLRRGFIRDNDVRPPPSDGPQTHIPPVADLLNVSPIARIVYASVTGWTKPSWDPAALPSLLNALIANHHDLGMVRRTPLLGSSGGADRPLLGELETIAHLVHPTTGEIYLLPDRPERLADPSVFARIAAARLTLDSYLSGRTWDPAELTKRITTDLTYSAEEFAFSREIPTTESWPYAHRTLFDTLYLLYVSRRWTTVNLEPVTTALQTLHAIRALAADALVSNLISRGPRATDAQKEWGHDLVRSRPELALLPPEQWPGFPGIENANGLRLHLAASPLIHKLFAQLFWYGRPFNRIQPVGVGDLKVVRQWLTAYRPGEISHIHNVMKGENRTRDHRRLESTEETFSLTSNRTAENTRDAQTTDRFEVKNESEQILKDAGNLNLTANSSLTYGPSTNMQVTVSAGLGYSSQHSFEDHEKAARTFARDVVDKAVERIENNTTTIRSTNKRVETRERNLQVLANDDGAHTSGVYRWVDKEYTAQVFSYGRRTMFEFMIPEPAAFWVAARLRGFEDILTMPTPPRKPSLLTVQMPAGVQTWADIDDTNYRDLASQYDLTAHLLPPLRRTVMLRTASERDHVIAQKDIPISLDGQTQVVACSLEGAAGYSMISAEVAGSVGFHGHVKIGHKNSLEMKLDNVLFFLHREEGTEWRPVRRHATPVSPLTFGTGETYLEVHSDGPLNRYSLSFLVDVELLQGSWVYQDWQQAVFKSIHDAERRVVDTINSERQAKYDAELADYRNAVEELRATAVADILRGGSEWANRATIAEELKKHCITMIAHEFDAVSDDDVLANQDATDTRSVLADRTRFGVTEDPALELPPVAEFTTTQIELKYPAIKIPETITKGRIVRFLDQAFEWETISYLCYPYFNAEMPRWIDLHNRHDDIDPAFSSFLRAGMARVLLAVTPKYECAVQHFLETREPWEGVDADPVIDDPLFVPLFEEVRARTDDRSGGTPVGDPWTYVVPTSLVYLHGSDTKLPDLRTENGGTP
jgi:hypothetical protein